MSASRGHHSTIRASGSGHKGSHRSPGPAFFKPSPRTSAVALACGLILGAGLVVQPAFPQPTTAPQPQAREQASSVTAASNATLSFNLAPAVFSYPQGKVYPASFPDSFGPGQPGQPGQPGVTGTALKGDLAGVVEYAYAGLGRPYVWGGTSFISGWDCSGFVQWAYRHAGIELPRVSQWAVLEPTTTPSPGDLVTQRPDGPNHWAHVGIYVGNGMMISALNPDEGTVLHSVGPEGSSWFFTTSVGAGADGPSGLVAGGPLIDYRAPAKAPSPAEVPSEGASSDARQDSTTKDEGKRRIEAATLSRVKVESGKTGNTSKISKTPERDKAGERDKADRKNPAGGEKTREKLSERDEETWTEKPQQEKPSDEESPKRDNTAGTDKAGRDKTGTEKTGPTEPPKPGTEETTGTDKTGNDKAAESGEAAESSGSSKDPIGSTGETSTEGPVDGSATEPKDVAPETGMSEEAGEASPEQTVMPEETEETADPVAPSAPASDTGNLQAAVAAVAMAQIGQEHDAVSFIEAVLTGAGYAPAPDGRDYLQLGETVATIEAAAAGDLLSYTDASGQTLTAIYLGEGLAVRGGGEGGQAVQFSLSEMTSSPVVIRLAGQP